MPVGSLLNKDQVATIVNNIRVNVPLNVDYIYDVYQMANEAIDMLNAQNTQIEVKEVNQFDLLLYCIGMDFSMTFHSASAQGEIPLERGNVRIIP